MYLISVKYANIFVYLSLKHSCDVKYINGHYTDNHFNF